MPVPARPDPGGSRKDTVGACKGSPTFCGGAVGSVRRSSEPAARPSLPRFCLLVRTPDWRSALPWWPCGVRRAPLSWCGGRQPTTDIGGHSLVHSGRYGALSVPSAGTIRSSAVPLVAADLLLDHTFAGSGVVEGCVDGWGGSRTIGSWGATVNDQNAVQPHRYDDDSIADGVGGPSLEAPEVDIGANGVGIIVSRPPRAPSPPSQSRRLTSPSSPSRWSYRTARVCSHRAISPPTCPISKRSHAKPTVTLQMSPGGHRLCSLQARTAGDSTD